MSSASSSRRSERVQFSGGNGFPLAGIVDAPETQPLARVLFSHCFTCGKDLKMTVRLSRALAERGLAVLRYDMTGLGSSGGDFSKTNVRSNIADLKAASEFLASDIGAPQFLIGHSFGGAASLAVTSELESVRGVVTLASPSDTRHLADVLVKLNPRIESEGTGEVVIGGNRFTIDRQMLDDFRGFDLPSRIAAITKPVLAFHSPTDSTVGYWNALQIVPADSTSSMIRSLITLPASDHLLTNNPADIPFVADMISAWVKRFV